MLSVKFKVLSEGILSFKFGGMFVPSAKTFAIAVPIVCDDVIHPELLGTGPGGEAQWAG
jgi:hypothetical protein